MNKLHITIEYAFYLAVRNVERQIVSRFVMGVQMFQSMIGIADLSYGFYLIGSLKLLMFSVYLSVFYFFCPY